MEHLNLSVKDTLRCFPIGAPVTFTQQCPTLKNVPWVVSNYRFIPGSRKKLVSYIIITCPKHNIPTSNTGWKYGATPRKNGLYLPVGPDEHDRRALRLGQPNPEFWSVEGSSFGEQNMFVMLLQESLAS